MGVRTWVEIVSQYHTEIVIKSDGPHQKLDANKARNWVLLIFFSASILHNNSYNKHMQRV